MAKNIKGYSASAWDTEYKLEKFVRSKYPLSVKKVNICVITELRKVEIEVHTGPITKLIPLRRQYMAKRLARNSRAHGIVGMKYKFKVL